MSRMPKLHSFNMSVPHGFTTCAPWFITVNIGLMLGKHGRVLASTYQCKNVLNY